jgi:hypothetical protein
VVPRPLRRFRNWAIGLGERAGAGRRLAPPSLNSITQFSNL